MEFVSKLEQLEKRHEELTKQMADPAVISDAGSNIRTLESRPDRQNAQINASLEIQDKRQLESILSNIRRINGIFGVERVNQVKS